MPETKDAVIVAYGRSAVGRSLKGALTNEHPVDYAAEVLTGVLNKVPQLDVNDIDDVMVGCALPEDVQGLNVARMISQRANLPDSVPAQTINRFCSSGIQTIATGANAIMANQADIIVAGGVESMSQVPMSFDMAGINPTLRAEKPQDYMPMGLTAEVVAEKFQVPREKMDEFAMHSHHKAAAAQEAHAFDDQIIPVHYGDIEGHTKVFDKDEGVRGNLTMDQLAALPPAFKEDGGQVTAGTSSPLSDGTAFVILMSADKAAELGVKPIARFVGYAVAGVNPAVMGLGPIYAAPKVMARTGLTIDDMDSIELNEAFASQSLVCIDKLNLPVDKVNPRGGALALGHPLGATGAILTCKILSYLQATGGRYGLVTMCIGGGMGAAGIYEMIPDEETAEATA